MCGGINLSQCIPVADDDNGKTPKNKIIFPSLLYNTGRVISYSVIGFLLGGMGMLLTGGGGMGIPLLLQGILKIIAGLFMVIMGINMLGWITLLRKFQIRFPQRLTDKIKKKKREQTVFCRTVEWADAVWPHAVHADYSTWIGKSCLRCGCDADVQSGNGSSDAWFWKSGYVRS